ncbi:MAG: hypothetical protein Ct9H300mP1_02490 [Planctomycetaceae bacterium]|nr:MAG: hypothetical protein Ct9H300mP1_02490 [Planctomycetaceae bacterium]
MDSRTPSLTSPVERIRSLQEPDISVFDVPLVRATPETLTGLASLEDSFQEAEVEIVTWPQPGWRPVVAGTGNEGGVTSGEFEVYREGQRVLGRNHAVDGYYVTGWFDDPGTASSETVRQTRHGSWSAKPITTPTAPKGVLSS